MARRNNYGGIQKTGPSRNEHNTRNQNQGQILVPIANTDGLQIRGAAGDGGGRGGYNDRGRGGRGQRGRGRGRGNHNDTTIRRSDIVAQIDQQHRFQNEQVTIAVKGVLESDVANESDNGLATCREWLEEWARQGLRRPINYVCLKSPKWKDDDMVFQVNKNDAWRILKADGEVFHNAVLSVRRADQQSKDTRSGTQKSTTRPMSAAEKVEIYTAVLAERYNADTKLLKLDYLGIDSRLNETGTWDPAATKRQHTDFFPGLMRVCEGENKAEKAEYVQSISLTNNDLTNVAPVFEIAKAFPDLRNLELSNNKIKDLRALELFRYRFKHLDWLVLSPNPIDTEDLDYEHTIMSWFPTLRTLNNARVRTDEAAASAVISEAKLPLNTIKDNFQDEAGIAESAIKELMKGFDADRPALARSLYDNESTFSISYNASAPRLDTAKSTSWEPHLKQSRNLKKVHQLEPRIRRMAKGISEIESALKILPPTRHPNLINESLQYSFDCVPIPGVPDPHDRIEAGVGGFKVDVHGSFEEYDRSTGLKNATRSFDRVFILGPGRGENQLRIVSDILMLRADGGYEAFNPEAKAMPDLPMVTKNFGFPTNTMAEDEAKQAFEVSKATGLRLELATQLLNESGWNSQTAHERFKVAREGEFGGAASSMAAFCGRTICE
ncbi:MAG: hypothetical protein LQ348_000854 [Seirophora lacunosa]|nr:MAG: hypothetical protein LQ348_000854 [Seirophora lacunosa]